MVTWSCANYRVFTCLPTASKASDVWLDTRELTKGAEGGRKVEGEVRECERKRWALK